MHFPTHHVIIVAVCIAFYYRILNYLLVVDDATQYHLMLNGQTCKLKDAGFVRWIKYKLYGFGGIFGVDKTNEKTQRRSIKLDHAVTVFLHTTICLLIYQVLGHNDIAFWASILYAVNPINHQTSIWSNGRRYALNIILVLVMLAMPRPWGLMAWVCTPFLHLTAVFAPIMLGWKYALVIPVAGMIAWYWQYKDYKMRLATQKTEEMIHYTPKRIIPSIKLFGFYFLRSVFPGRVMLVYPHLYFWGLTDKGTQEAHSFNFDFYKGVSAVIITVIGIFLLNGQERLYLIFAALSIIQWSGLLMVTQHSCDRYTATATPFMMYLVSYLAFTYFHPIAIPVVLFLTGLYISELNVVMLMYKNMLAFHAYENFFYPDNIISRQSLIHGMMAEKRPLEAWYQVQEALKYHPNDMRINILASEICLVMADKKMAQMHLNLAVQGCYDGQFESQKPCFEDIQRRIDAPQVFQHESRNGSKYSPKPRTPAKRELQLV